jgi:hypothetical protein
MVKIFCYDNTAFNYTKTNSCGTLVITKDPVLSETYANAITRNKSHILHGQWVLTLQIPANRIVLLLMSISLSRNYGLIDLYIVTQRIPVEVQ